MTKKEFLSEEINPKEKKKHLYETPRVLASYNKEELEAVMQQEGVSGGPACSF